MEDGATRKSKDTDEKESLTTVAQSSSSADPEPEIVQESKRIKQEDTPSASSSPTAQISSIPPASHSQRPLYNPPLSGSTDSSQQPESYSNPAQILLHKPEERARAKFGLERQKAKKGKSDWIDPITRKPAPSPLGPGPDPYKRVQEVVSDVKEHLARMMALKLASKKSNQPPSATRVVSSSSSSSSDDSGSEPGTVEEVIVKLEKYLEGIPRTVSVQEMEDKLVEFQVKVDVDPTPTWYGLMRKSTMAFWDNLTDYFVCEALESDLEDDDDDVDDDDDLADKSAGGSAST